MKHYKVNLHTLEFISNKLGDDASDVVTEVKNETLVVKMKDHWGSKMKKISIKVYVSAPELEGISSSGGADIHK